MFHFHTINTLTTQDTHKEAHKNNRPHTNRTIKMKLFQSIRRQKKQYDFEWLGRAHLFIKTKFDCVLFACFFARARLSSNNQLMVSSVKRVIVLNSTTVPCIKTLPFHVLADQSVWTRSCSRLRRWWLTDGFRGCCCLLFRTCCIKLLDKQRRVAILAPPDSLSSCLSSTASHWQAGNPVPPNY